MNKACVGMIGAGNMGSAIIGGIVDQYDVVICEKDVERAEMLKTQYSVTNLNLEGLLQQSDAIILAVKPQNFKEVLEDVVKHPIQDKLIISIAAGITTLYIEKALGESVKVVRTMPNLPVLVGQGMTGIAKGQKASEDDVGFVKNIFDCVGSTVVVEEALLDAVTAVSGSGPAYVFLFMECFIKAAQDLGLTQEMSSELVKQTLKGSLTLLEKSEDGPDLWRQRVTSKGGTTQAALEKFEAHQLSSIFAKALLAAKTRSTELSQ